jgi:methyl-accepting chemotaxis protein
MRLSTKLALAVVAAVGLPILIIGLFVTNLIYNRAKAEAENERQAKVAALKQNLEIADRFLHDKTQTALSLLKQEYAAVAPMNGEQAAKITSRIKELNKTATAVYVRGGDGFAIAGASSDFKPENLVGENSFAAAIGAGKSFSGIAEIGGERFFSAIEPFRNVAGEVTGAFFAAVPLSDFDAVQKTAENSQILEKGFVALVDDQNRIVYKPATASDETIKQVLSATETENDWNAKSETFPAWNYKIVSAFSDDDPQLINALWSARMRVIGGDLFFMLLLGGLIFFLTRRFLQPLEAVTAAANRLAQGDFSVEIKSRSNDEAGQAARALQDVTVYLREMSQVAERIAAGDFSVHIQPRSSADRFGVTFQNMFERTSRLVQTQQERDRLQRSIMKLLDEVSEVANGDLTAEAEVTADATGAIADAFNFMIAELRAIIGRVKETGEQVDASASQIQRRTEMLVQRSEEQSAKLNQLSDALEQMSAAMQKIAQETGASVRVSDDALANAKQGANAIGKNISAMKRLSSRVQETAGRIKRLGERSQEISAIVKIIRDLAQRTSVLALNASIQAAAAGQQGRGFVAVAEEVEKLAERSAVASKQIDALTKAIEGETNEAVESMETTVKEVAVGVKLTDEVGEALMQIEAVTHQLSNINHTIAIAARQQAQTSEDISGSVKVVAGVSQTTAAGMRESAASVRQLAEWTHNLRDSVASFRLPETEKNINAEKNFRIDDPAEHSRVENGKPNLVTV